jgi:hypothetical protein
VTMLPSSSFPPNEGFRSTRSATTSSRRTYII